MKRLRRKIYACLLILALAISLFPVTNVRAEGIGTITLTKWPVDGTIFSLYKVAGLNGTAFIPEGAYKSLITNEGKELYGMSNEKWQQLANEVKDAALTNKITPVETLKYQVNGTNTFRNLDVGLYLVEENTVKRGDTTYTSQNSLVRVPDSDIHYDVKVELKVSDNTPESTDSTTSVTPTGISSKPEKPEETAKPTKVPINKPSVKPSTVPTKAPANSAHNGEKAPGHKPQNMSNRTSTAKNPAAKPATATAGKTTKINGKVKTGDQSEDIFYIGVIAADAGMVILYLALRNRKKQGEA